MKEKSKCRRKKREGDFDIHDDKRHSSSGDAKDRRYVEERRVVGAFEEKRSRHPLDPLYDRKYKYPSEEKRYRSTNLDDRRSRHEADDRKSRNENGERRNGDWYLKDRETRLNGSHHHRHRRKHKSKEDSSDDPPHKKKKSCRRKRERKPIEDNKMDTAAKEKSRSISPSPSSSSSSPSPVRMPTQGPSPPAPPPPAPAPKVKQPVRDIAPGPALESTPQPEATNTGTSSWSDDEKPARYRKQWGKDDAEDKGDKEKKPPAENKAKPDFGLSGKLTEETNMYKGVLIKYSQPPEARMPKRRWRLYPFKGDQALPTLYIHRQSAYLIGRERKIVDIPVDHPSISKQHAVLQYRLVPYTRDDGSKGQRIRPYIIDLDSANGTFVNNQKIETSKYVELLERDVLKFAFSSREYVLLHEQSSDGNQDDEAV